MPTKHTIELRLVRARLLLVTGCPHVFWLSDGGEENREKNLRKLEKRESKKKKAQKQQTSTIRKWMANTNLLLASSLFEYLSRCEDLRMEFNLHPHARFGLAFAANSRTTTQTMFFFSFLARESYTSCLRYLYGWPVMFGKGDNGGCPTNNSIYICILLYIQMNEMYDRALSRSGSKCNWLINCHRPFGQLYFEIIQTISI